MPVGVRGDQLNQAGPQGPGAGPAGKDGLVGPTESVRSCTPDLWIDDAPASDGSSGSGGWGWDTSANAPVTSVAVGDASDPLTVTVLQPNTETADGDITVTYNPYDFSLVSESDGTCTTLNGNTEACTYSDLAHSAKSVSFGFKPLHANPDAVVTATVDVNGEQATAQFPVAITSSPRPPSARQPVSGRALTCTEQQAARLAACGAMRLPAIRLAAVTMRVRAAASSRRAIRGLARITWLPL